MARALIVGSRGQDGTLLTELLVTRGVAVVGAERAGVTGLGDRTDAPRALDLRDPASVRELVRDAAPEELYYLAAHHHSSEEAPDFADEIQKCSDVHVLGFVNMLEALRAHAPRCRAFYAGS